MSIEDKLKELGIELQTPPSPVANYIPVSYTHLTLPTILRV